jgi:glycosyltransferase involved in cell wall biosynthesis
MEAASQRPLVSVILAVFNEAGSIRKCMTSLLEQETPGFELEILAVDGGSTDGTKDYMEGIASIDSRVRVLHNEQRRAPFAFNLGLREAKGEYVCIFGAHSVYAKNYISVCLGELLAQSVLGCGGRVLTEPSADTLPARLVALALGHPFGSSRKSIRTRSEGFSTAAFMVIRKSPLMDVGGYSEKLHRNQDNDTYERLEAKGHKFFCTWKTQCIYYPKSSIREMLRYGFRMGLWVVISLEQNPSSMDTRHFVPFLFVMSMVAGALLGLAGVIVRFPYWGFAWAPLAAIVGLHLTAGLIAGVQAAMQKRFVGALALPFVFFAFHSSYGLGTLWAFLRGTRPSRSVPQTLASRDVLGNSATSD